MSNGVVLSNTSTLEGKMSNGVEEVILLNTSTEEGKISSFVDEFSI